MDSKRVFEGVKIADFAWIGVGPITVKYLADHGATVVHVESSTRPDSLRLGQPAKGGVAGINNSHFFANFNSSKYSLSLDLSKPEARETARRLVQWADVVAESYTPKAMRNWGLDYESLVEIKPDLVMVSTCQQGQTGPHALFAGAGNTGASLAGFYSFTGWPDRGPGYVAGAYTDFISPRFLAAALVAALDYRRRTGKGQHIDQSQIEAGVQFAAVPVLDQTVNGRIMGRLGNRSPDHAPHGAYPCAGEDRWCAIAVASDEEWRGLRTAMGDPEWARDPGLDTLAGRKEREEELDRRLGEWTAGHDAEGLQDLLQGHGVPAGVVATTEDLYNDPQLQHRGHFRTLDHANIGPVPFDGPSFRLSKTPDTQFAAPTLGQHNDMVLRDILGMTDAEVAALEAAGALV
jgi:benzylsuccinate CoA-transferase BbsF subunit